MSDLISRSTAMENYCNALCPKLQKDEYCNDCIVKAWLNNQPTAYDTDKVVEQLEELKSLVPVNRLLDDIVNEKPKELGMLIAYSKAIEIVKGGGK